MNFYHYLGVPENANTDQIRKAFRKLAKTKHPDYNKDDSAFWDMVELNLIRDTLLNPNKRAEYDLSLKKGLDFTEISKTTHVSQRKKNSKKYSTILFTSLRKINSLFTFKCQVCFIEMRSTWKGYCLLHYLEYTGQLHNQDFIFDYNGYKFQWADPPSELIETIEKQKQKSNPTYTEYKITKFHIIIYTILLIFIVILILILFINFIIIQ